MVIFCFLSNSEIFFPKEAPEQQKFQTKKRSTNFFLFLQKSLDHKQKRGLTGFIAIFCGVVVDRDFRHQSG